MEENTINPIPNDRRNIASFLVSSVLLERALNMPEGYRFLHFENDISSNCLKIFVEGHGLPEISSGEIPKNIRPLITKIPIEQEDGSVKFEFQWDWNVGA